MQQQLFDLEDLIRNRREPDLRRRYVSEGWRCRDCGQDIEESVRIDGSFRASVRHYRVCPARRCIEDVDVSRSGVL